MREKKKHFISPILTSGEILRLTYQRTRTIPFRLTLGKEQRRIRDPGLRVRHKETPMRTSGRMREQEAMATPRAGTTAMEGAHGETDPENAGGLHPGAEKGGRRREETESRDGRWNLSRILLTSVMTDLAPVAALRGEDLRIIGSLT
jgi:hypothetical protein